jgi:hypothetical protein
MPKDQLKATVPADIQVWVVTSLVAGAISGSMPRFDTDA